MHCQHFLQLCKSINGGLLEVDDLSEHQFVSAELQKLHPDLSDLNVTYWTGLIELREEGTFFWTDSKTRPEFDVRIADHKTSQSIPIDKLVA